MDLKDIKAIIDLMKKNSISEFELEKQEFKIKLKRGGIQISQPYEETAQALSIPVSASTASLQSQRLRHFWQYLEIWKSSRL